MSKKLRPKKHKHSVCVNGYTYRWDSDDEDEMDAIFEEWGNRDWLAWLRQHLCFPFQAKRVEDDDDAYFEEGVAGKPFRLDSKIEVVALSGINEDIDLDFDGVIVEARHEGKKGEVPLQDLEVVPPDDPNYGPVKEWVVHYANR